MKKLYVLAMVLTVAACFAYASTMSVPWFVDNAATKCGLPPVTGGIVGLVYLHNNQATPIVCEIQYYSQEGALLGPATDNTFSIPALATIAFRPYADDPASAGGMEAAAAALVPNRPTEDGKKNGSIVIKWAGDPGLVQGIVLQTQNVDGTGTGRLLQWGTLLPAGIATAP